MSKNAFNKSNQAVQTDPVAEAQAKAAAEQQAQQEQAATEQQKQQTEVPQLAKAADLAASLVQTTNEVQEPVEGAAAAEAVAEVQETVEQRQVQSLQPVAVARKVTETTDAIVRAGAKARELSPAVAQPNGVTTSAGFAAMIAKERKEGTANAQHLISFLDTYVNVMRPRKITSSADVLQMQEGLHDVLVSVIEKAPSNEFKRLWRLAIAYFTEYQDGCFGPLYINRGVKDWRRAPSQFDTLSSLSNLLIASAQDIKTVSQTVNVNAVAGRGFTEEGRGRLINFYMN